VFVDDAEGNEIPLHRPKSSAEVYISVHVLRTWICKSRSHMKPNMLAIRSLRAGSTFLVGRQRSTYDHSYLLVGLSTITKCRISFEISLLAGERANSTFQEFLHALHNFKPAFLVFDFCGKR
jgi:hypothetical protein